MRFAPTEGRSWAWEMFRTESVSEGPIPECRRMCGVEIDPAERMTSFEAVRVARGAIEDMHKQRVPG